MMAICYGLAQSQYRNTPFIVENESELPPSPPTYPKVSGHPRLFNPTQHTPVKERQFVFFYNT